MVKKIWLETSSRKRSCSSESASPADLSNKKLSEEAELVNKELFEDILRQQLNDKEEDFKKQLSCLCQCWESRVEKQIEMEKQALVCSSFTYLRLRCWSHSLFSSSARRQRRRKEGVLAKAIWSIINRTSKPPAPQLLLFFHLYPHG